MKKKSIRIAKLAKRNAASVADTLATHLQGAIMQGSFAVGSSLPSERELMTNFSVSRTTVREALRVLGAQGLVEIKRGRTGGAYVSNRTSKSLLNSLDIFIKGHNIRFIDLVFVREAIEPVAAAQAAMSRTPEQLDDLHRRCVECEARFDETAGFVKANHDWHFSVVKASNNPLFITFMTSIAAAFHTATDREEFDLVTRKAVVGIHWQIFEAIRLSDPDAARRRMTRHLTAYGEKLSSLDLRHRHN
jgi:GntR family transcriptional repressor for pyruvate dehydrogenase complex